MQSKVSKCHWGTWEAKSANRSLLVRLSFGSVLELEQVVDRKQLVPNVKKSQAEDVLGPQL